MPQTYIRTVSSGAVGRISPAAVSYTRGGSPPGGNLGTAGDDHESMPAKLSGRLHRVDGYLVTETRVIAAPAQRLFDIVADPAMHPVMDGSGTVRALRDGGPDRLSLGATFGMDMHVRASYKILNRVIEFDESRLIAWRHFNGHVWRYRFEPADGGTLVTEEWDARPAKRRWLLRLLGYPARNRRGMAATLDKLDRLATAEPSPDKLAP
jgi:hypothetical protein